jgi:hypothetical protein
MPSETRRFEVHQLPAFHAANFAAGLSENAPRSPGATFPDASIEANRGWLKPIEAH